MMTRSFLLVLLCLSAPVRGQVAPPSAAQMVDALNGIFGVQRHARANHANGILLKATFTPDPAAATVTRAIHFQATPTAVTVRFSNFGGYPNSIDADPGAAPYGMSLKFALPDGTETDLVMHSFNGFPARTTEEFRDFLLAMARSPVGSRHPTALETYAAAHERAQFFLDAPKPPPLSFSSQPYFGVNTFTFIDAAGHVKFGRYRVVPQDGMRYLGAERSVHTAGNYLHAEIVQRIARAPVRMLLQLQLAGPGDALDDPSIAWPDDRQLLALGTLLLQAPVADSKTMDQTLVFFPDDLPDGIEAHDPMLKARTKAYSESYERRQR